mgnify:CR=1 FL=1
MSAETIIVTATTIAVRALIDGIAALREGAKADERAEIERLLAGLHASAPQPVASSLDEIRDVHLARVAREKARRAVEEWPRSPVPLVTLATEHMGDLYELKRYPLDPVESEDPDQ